MKTRTGFVSNSSSSSFIVIAPAEAIPGWEKPMIDPDELMTDEDLALVVKYGFRPTAHRSPMMLEFDHDEKDADRPMSPKASRLGLSVPCNEDEVIEFLVGNNIPFSGTCHYGHESVFFRRGWKKVLFMANTGLQYEMYGHRDVADLVNLITKKKPVRKVSVKSIIGGRK